MENAFSIDLEEWWCNEYLDNSADNYCTDGFIEESVGRILDLLEEYDIEVTFFVLGRVAKNYPHLVKEIYSRGHEIACHGFSHKPLTDMSQADFEAEIEESMHYIGKYSPIGFRAPSFSLNNETKWALEVLEKYGFKYDSSIFPTLTPLYGVPNAPVSIYRPSKRSIEINDPEGPLLEFPLSVRNFFGYHLPVSGGFYLRMYPKKFLISAIRVINKERPAVIYIHPWEICPNIPKLKNTGFSGRLVGYYNKESTWEKIVALLDEYEFRPLRELLLSKAE